MLYHGYSQEGYSQNWSYHTAETGTYNNKNVETCGTYSLIISE